MNRGQDADRPLGPAGSAGHGWLHGISAVHATLLYALLAVAWTWPLATGLASDVPWDLGDPLLNCWILAWHFHQAGRVLHGDLGAFADWWHPNIFHPVAVCPRTVRAARRAGVAGRPGLRPDR